MSSSKTTASLSPSLLARKGGAKPAMRPQLQPLHEFHEATARDMSEDLGWNDMGEAGEADAHLHANDTAQIIPMNVTEALSGSKPEVRQHQEELANHFAPASVERRSALDQGRRAAFTLRIDADRHLRLRLASTIANRSAQQIVTEALDRFLAGMPEVDSLAAKVRESR